MEIVNFYNQVGVNSDAVDEFNTQKERIRKVIPDADIQHVGSSAIPNSLSKGDLDIQVRVSSSSFPQAVEKLSKLYDLNKGSTKTSEFRAFQDDTTSSPLGIQLTVIDSEYDFFWKFRDVLLQNDKYRSDYDNLKEKYEAKAMNDYREAKNGFFNRIKQTKEYKKI